MKKSEKKFLPLFHQSEGKKALVVGGGAVAFRRCRILLDAGFVLTVVALAFDPVLKAMLEKHNAAIKQKAYEPDDIDNQYLVVAATDDVAVNQAIANVCKKRNIPVNVADNAHACDFVFSSVVERGPLKIAVSAGGKSPVLARLLKHLINGLVPSGYGELAGLVGEYRQKVRRAIPDEKQRIAFWESVLQGAVAEAVFSGKKAEAQSLLEKAVENPEKTIGAGEVYLIGAGPGDPGLLTLRAFRLIQQADVVLYDRLVSDEVMSLIRPDAEKIYVGKRRANHAVPQDDINRLLVQHAKQGKRVARLKGGDPFVFGRGGEEIEELSSESIPFQVIPGITAANGCAAYAGIPLTHRDHAQSVRFVTGQLKDGTVDLDWKTLVQPGQTLVFYMGLKGLPIIARELVLHGADKKLPIALIEKGTTMDQQVHIATLETIVDVLENASVKSPSLLIVGSVVSLHGKLQWFDKGRGH
ncbi:MAG: uroporphyrinogen-III C-methyltransferase [Pseudomonadales bacterium]|nr:uroporphyrinogen-III C-methyltransferase [Pseudomonadales bacterium]